MKAAADTLPPVGSLGAEWYKAPIDLNDWARSARRLWQFYRRRTRHKKREFDYRDREIGREIGGDGPPPSRRTIQRGHWFLEYIYKVIVRDHSGGHGRVVRILLPLAGEDKEEEKPRAKSPAKASTKPAPSPSPTPTPKPTDPTTADDRPLEPGEAKRIWEEERARAKVQADAGKAAGRPQAPQGVDGVEKAARELGADERARLEALEARGELTSNERRILEAARRIHAP